jgi:transposase
VHGTGFPLAACSAGGGFWRKDAAPRPQGTAPATEFVPVTLVGDAPAAPAAELTLVLSDGLRLEIGAQCSAETLQRVLGVLRERA